MKVVSLVKAIIIVFISCVTLTGCYDAVEVDDFAYVSALGLDKGKVNELRMTLEIMVPTASVGSNNGGGGGGGANVGPTTVTTIETPSIYSGLNMINNYLSKQINVSHAKLLVISEEIAREGMDKYLHAFMRGREFRGGMHIAVSKGSAEEYIKVIKPIIESNVSKYHELRHSSYKYTALTANTTLIDFYLRAECTCSQAVANLVSKSGFDSSEDFSIQDSTYAEKGRSRPLEGDYIAGYIPQVGDTKNEAMGLAVFDGHKMVGKLDGGETKCFLMVSGQFERAYITFEDPLAHDKFIVLDVRQKSAPYKNVTMQNDIPLCEAKIYLEADILSIQSGINYESVENLPLLESAAEDFLRTGITRFLEKTAREFNSDICAFGRELKKKLMLWDDWKYFNWLGKYKDAVFNIDVDLKIRRTGLMIRSNPLYSTQGEEY